MPIDPASGRAYEVGPDGTSRWIDAPTPAPIGVLGTQVLPKKSAKRWVIPLVTGILGLIIGSASAGGAKTTTTAASTVTVTSTSVSTVKGAAITQTVAAAAQTSAAPAAAPAAASVEGDGTYEVGTDIQPGTYKSTKPASGNCYWARLKGEGGTFGDIIANNNSSGPSVVTILKTDKVFQTTGCEKWVRTR